MREGKGGEAGGWGMKRGSRREKAEKGGGLGETWQGQNQECKELGEREGRSGGEVEENGKKGRERPEEEQKGKRTVENHQGRLSQHKLTRMFAP